MVKKQILVIDDDLSVCRLIREAMQDDYTDVCYTMSVEEALDTFATYDYCLVVVNLHLSEADGTKILRIIRQTKTMPILVLAERLTEPEKFTLFQMGANAVLEKTIDMSVCGPGKFPDSAIHGADRKLVISSTDLRNGTDH